MSIKNRHGASLLEVIIATAFVSSLIIVLAMAIPRASKSSYHNRQHWAAVNAATSYIANLKGQGYAWIDPTPSSYFSDPTCNCNGLDFSVLPSTPSTSVGMDFQIQSCVNYIVQGAGNTWTSQCPASGDTGYKNILVKVSWTQDTKRVSVSQEASMSRF